MKSLVVYSVKQHQFGRTGRAVVQLGNDSRRCSTSDFTYMNNSEIVLNTRLESTSEKAISEK